MQMMRNSAFGMAGTFLCLLLISPGVVAGPFASQIQWSAASANFQVQTVDIEYRLNAAADTVTIEVLPSGGSTSVASFAGTADVGWNTVTWNGSTDNAGGPLVPAGDFVLRIRAQSSGPADWSLVRSNSTVGGGGDLETLPNLFPARGVATEVDPENPAFGQIFLSQSSGGSDNTHGVLRLFSDLELVEGGALILDDLDWVGTGTSNESPWGMAVAPDGEIWASGQGDVEIARGQPDGTGDTDVAGSESTVLSPRDVLLVGTGSGRVLRWIQGNQTEGAVYRASIGDAPSLSGVTVVKEIDGSSGQGFFGRNLAADDGGNVYLLVGDPQPLGITDVYRFDAATLAAGPWPLNVSQASWDVTIDGGASLRGSGVGIDHGDQTDPDDDIIYALVPLNSSFGEEAGIYRVGISGTPTLVTTVSSAERVVDLSSVALSDQLTDLACDFGGNLILEDPFNEVVHVHSPPGPSDVTVPGPSSQVLAVSGEPPEKSGLSFR
jgi:SAM-dependent methyltransferase